MHMVRMFFCALFPPEAVVNDINGENRTGAADVSASQHVMVCALKELGSLFQSLSATASPLIQEPSVGETSCMVFIFVLTYFQFE